MWGVIGAILLASFLLLALKLAIIVLIIAGLIFRTKETLGALLLFAIITAFNAHPWIGLGIGGTLIAVRLLFEHREKQATDSPSSLPRPDY